MDKLYFAKYLPVEGEIKEGDTFLEHGISYRLLHKKVDEWVICTLNLEKQFSTVCKNPVKSKLFLCSKDIQVGDKAIYENKEVIITGYDERFLIWEFEGMPAPVDYDKKLLFKIIGEISPEATWIKEGDEFDEYEVQKMADLSSTNRTNYLPWVEGREKLGYKCIVFVKGSCGHFH